MKKRFEPYEVKTVYDSILKSGIKDQSQVVKQLFDHGISLYFQSRYLVPNNLMSVSELAAAALNNGEDIYDVISSFRTGLGLPDEHVLQLLKEIGQTNLNALLVLRNQYNLTVGELSTMTKAAWKEVKGLDMLIQSFIDHANNGTPTQPKQFETPGQKQEPNDVSVAGGEEPTKEASAIKNILASF